MVPTAQLDQRVEPLVQVPSADVRPHVANLLLACAPNLLHVMEVFLDGPPRGSRFQNVAHFCRGFCAEVGYPTAVLETNDHHADHAADQRGRGQKRLVLTRHLDPAGRVGDRLPALAMPCPLGQADLVVAVDAVAMRPLGRQGPSGPNGRWGYPLGSTAHNMLWFTRLDRC